MNHMDNLTLARPAASSNASPERNISSGPSFTAESQSALETLDRCRILLEMEYERSSRSVKDRLINPMEQVRNALRAIKQITEKS
jgi:hypothetical protein